MKHPLTSKERRGLAAVAAAALLCVFAGFVFRGCSGGDARGRSGDIPAIIDNDTARSKDARLDSTGRRGERPSKNTKKGKRNRKAASKEKAYPTREPLDEACD